ncbi:erf1 methyltransferase catalytic subunit mtq2 [Acrodontium crateriforme]|uniref:Erf1 methyltransferase catalytic subunit mtq2 n=1 Tax=Acrodontium crateriforme TaxID=150365 RepID=A0AAQ3RBY4_9PEZI|nr:erf1 methyltransferase catalytic subunit mtq2 [Acrodontium crateriforme]
MLPTPSTSHVDYDRIYEPAEDSYLLLDTLSSPSEVEFLSKQFPQSEIAPLVLEVGTGSGVVLAFVTGNAGHIFGRNDVATLGVDVNEFACEGTIQTVQGAVKDAAAASGNPGQFLECCKGDLTSAVKPQSIDVLIFNPPYVPTEHLPILTGMNYDSAMTSSQKFERDSHLLSLSYAGGADGMETTNRLLDELPVVLSHRGIGYVLLCAQNRPHDVIARIQAWTGDWTAEIVGSSGKKAGWEKLCILRIWRREPCP